MRFAWLREQAGQSDNVAQNLAEWLIFIAYNLVYWLPLVLVIAGRIEHRTGVITFAIIIALRTVLNWYRLNVLPPEQGQRFPLRAP